MIEGIENGQIDHLQFLIDGLTIFNIYKIEGVSVRRPEYSQDLQARLPSSSIHCEGFYFGVTIDVNDNKWDTIAIWTSGLSPHWNFPTLAHAKHTPESENVTFDLWKTEGNMIDKSFHKVFLTILILLLAMLACGAPTTPSTSAEPNQLPQIFPTSVAGEQVVITTSVTDSQGKAEFEDPLIQRPIAVKVADSDSNQALQGISVSFVSNGPRFLIFAIDPNKRYMPIVEEVDYKDVGVLKQHGHAKLASPPEQSELIDAYILMRALSAYHTAQDWIATFQNPPDLDRWAFLSQDYCVNSDQMANGLRGAIGTLSLVIPGPIGSMVNITAPSLLLDLAWLTAAAELGDNLMVDTAKDALSDFIASSGAIIKWRVFSINGLPFGLPAVAVGWCLEPLNRASLGSVSEWLQYGFRTQEMYAFEILTPNVNIQAGIPATEAGGVITGEELLQNLERSLPNGISCEFTFMTESSVVVATSGWNPPFILPYTINLMTNEVSATNIPSGYVLISASDGYVSSVGIGAYPEGTDPLEVWSLSATNQQPCH